MQFDDLDWRRHAAWRFSVFFLIAITLCACGGGPIVAHYRLEFVSHDADRAGRFVAGDRDIHKAERCSHTHLQAIELLRDPSHVRNRTLAQWTAALARARFELTGLSTRGLRTVFDVWTARTRTLESHIRAIRSTQSLAPEAVRSHLAIGEDGSFDIESTSFWLRAASPSVNPA